MNIRILFLFLVLLAAGACSTVQNMKTASDFSTSSEKYNQLLRWHEMESAGMRFAADSIRDEYINEARVAKGVTITDYRVVSQECNLEKNNATVVVDIDYYIPPSVTLKTVQDVQKWEYIEENGSKSWRLVSLPPTFK